VTGAKVADAETTISRNATVPPTPRRQGNRLRQVSSSPFASLPWPTSFSVSISR
jgi:hypothetical protein